VIMVETDRVVTGGVDTHLDVHVAAALDPIGGLLGVESFDTTRAGYETLVAWLSGFGVPRRVGVEGTGSYGAGLARFLHDRGVEVIEVDRPNRRARFRTGKSDPVDAIEAARAALLDRATGLAKTKDGPVEAIRALLVARRSARNHRISTLVQMRHLVFTAPQELRDRFFGLSKTQQVTHAAALRPRHNGDPVTYATKVALKGLAQRVQLIETHIKEIRRLLRPLITTATPSLLDIHGVGPNVPLVVDFATLDGGGVERRYWWCCAAYQ
jgi:transposase